MNKLVELGFTKQEMIIFTRQDYQIAFDLINKTWSIGGRDMENIPTEILEAIEEIKIELDF